MKIAKIKKLNPQTFLDDLKRVKSVMVYAAQTDSYYYITKKDLSRDAESKCINYFVGNDLDSPSELTMVVR